MLNRRTWIDTFIVDLTRMANEPMEAVLANVHEAYNAAVKMYDLSNAEKFVVSGKNKTPMGRKITWSMVRQSPTGVTLKLFVSKKPLSIRDLYVRPSLDHDTTGRNRQPVFVACRKSKTIEVPDGFIWNGTVFMRTGDWDNPITSAKSFLIKSGADVSPARMLGEVKQEVVDAALEVFSNAIDYASSNRK